MGAADLGGAGVLEERGAAGIAVLVVQLRHRVRRGIRRAERRRAISTE